MATATPLDCLLHSNRLQRCRYQNILLRKKAGRLMALRGMRRGLQLRQHLAQANVATSCPSTDGRQSLDNTPHALDPSVKALVDQLADIAQILQARDKEGGGKRQAPSALHPADPCVPPGSADTRFDSPINPVGTCQSSHLVTASPSSPLRESSTIVEGTDIGKTHTNDQTVGFARGSGNHVMPQERDRNVAQCGSEPVEDGFEGGGVPFSAGDELFAQDDVISQRLAKLDADMSSLFQGLEDRSQEANQEQKTAASSGDGVISDRQEEAINRRTERVKKRERAALMAQLARAGKGSYRRPRWRWLEDGVANPDPDRVLRGKTFWRAAVLLVIVFYVRPKRLLMQRKARSKDRDTQDWNATLTIYFDRCQTWLLKSTRAPVGNSILKNPKLNLRLNRQEHVRDEYADSPHRVTSSKGGLVSALVRAVARGVSQEKHGLTLMRLKVHAKGVIHGLTQEMPPSDIMTFFGYLAGDGNYFPKDFFFDAENTMLSFDELGAVRKLAAEVPPPGDVKNTRYALHPSDDLQDELEASARSPPDVYLKADLRAAVLHGSQTLTGKLRPLFRHEANGRWFDTSLVEMILTNYVMVRVLIPWILLYPRESGLTASSGIKPSLLGHNCQVLASIVYLIVRVLRPELTPPNSASIKAAAAAETQRAAATVALEHEEDHEHAHNESSDAESDDGQKEGEGKNAQASGGLNTSGPGELLDEGRPDRTRRRRRHSKKRRKSQAVAVVKPRTVLEILREKRYVSLSDKQLIAGLLPDAYFMSVAEQLRPWVLQLAHELDVWMQEVIAGVMSKVTLVVGVGGR